MTSRRTERLTLHFDLSHCSLDQDFSLGVLGKRYALTRHSSETFNQHATKNRALALIPASAQHRVTHFVEEVELPADAVGFHLVTYPSTDPNSIPELALGFVHIPTEAKRRHFHRKRKQGARKPHASSLTHFGVDTTALAVHELPVVHLDATQVLTPFQAAELIIFNHPDLMTTRQDVASSIIYDHISAALNVTSELPDFISQFPYYTIETTTNPLTGEVVNPITTDEDGNPIVDKEGNPLTWPQQNGQNVIQRYKLLPGVIGTPDSGRSGAVFGALAAVLASTKDDLSLNGQCWSVQHGITVKEQTQVQPGRSGPLKLVQADAPGFQWSLSSLTSMYGLDLDRSSLTFDSTSKNLSFKVKNWANRYLGAYVKFYDEAGTQIGDTHFVTKISSGVTLCGAPIWSDNTKLSYAMPDNATKADWYLGGIGIGNADAALDELGITHTAIFNYAVPSFLVGLSVGTTGLRLATKSLESVTATAVIKVVEGFIGAPVVIITAMKNPMALISLFSEIAIGLIFSKGLEQVATAITGYATATKVLENVPIVGWTFQVLSCSAGIADMAATTGEVCQSPATYSIETTRTINLQVDVDADPTHGVKGQRPIWPLESYTWEVVVQYKGGTSIKQSGGMDSIKPDDTLSVLFSGNSAIPAAPSAQIQVSVNLYSRTNWLCGKWSSAWVAAVAPDGNTLNLKGSIIEFLVPLTPQTQYSHYQKLGFQDGHHVWQTTLPPTATRSSLDCSNSGNALCRPVNITMNDLAYAIGYTYQASGQNLPQDFGTQPTAGQIYAFQSISALGNPEAGLKKPTVGFSLQPYMAYDQFGPAPLFTLPSTTYQPELAAANNSAVPSDLVTAFANAAKSADQNTQQTGSGNLTLPTDAKVTVVTATAEWYISSQGHTLYDLRRETDTINVFRYPTPIFSPRNYYLDSRLSNNNNYYLRQVVLEEKSDLFDYSTGFSWGQFTNVTLDAIAVHPNGYVIGVNSENHKLMILTLPAAVVADADAPVALPMSGLGAREGLLNGPISLTITADGRILVLEQANGRIQAFDTAANPVSCFPGPFTFTLDSGFKSDLNSNNLSTDFQQAYQQQVQPRLARVFGLPLSSGSDLDAGTVTDQLKRQFANNALPLSANGPYQILKTQPGSMWLLFDQGASVAYDIRKDLYVKLNGNVIFTLPASFASDLDAGTVSSALIHEFKDYGVVLSSPAQLQLFAPTPGFDWLLEDIEQSQVYDITFQANAYVYQGSSFLFNLPAVYAGTLDQGGVPPDDLVAIFNGQGLNLSSSLQVEVINAGASWQLVDQGKNVTYDITMDQNLDVFHAPTFEVEVKSVDTEWILRDKVNTLTFDIKQDPTHSANLNAQQLLSIMPLKDGVSSDFTYLDIGVETKGFIYVLSYAGTGSKPSDYRLDIYNPDGSWLARTAGLNGARFVVDQWRNLYTLNYEVLLGPNNRTEPTVSTWIPSTPTGKS